VQPGFHSSHGAVADLGNLRQAELLVVVQHKADAVLFPQMTQGEFEFFRQLLIAGRRAVGHVVDQFRSQFAISAERECGPAAIHRNPQDPRLQWTLLIEPGQASQRPHQSFLGHILSILTMGQNSLGDAEDEPLKPRDKFADSPAVSRQTAFDQQGFTPLGTVCEIGDEIHQPVRRGM
jgi:hypothetical protein